MLICKATPMTMKYGNLQSTTQHEQRPPPHPIRLLSHCQPHGPLSRSYAGRCEKETRGGSIRIRWLLILPLVEMRILLMKWKSIHTVKGIFRIEKCASKLRHQPIADQSASPSIDHYILYILTLLGIMLSWKVGLKKMESCNENKYMKAIVFESKFCQVNLVDSFYVLVEKFCFHRVFWSSVCKLQIESFIL